MSLADKYQVQFLDDGCAILTMRNGQNRFNLMTLQQINRALDEVERNQSCKILVTTGEGRFYSNGIDLDWLMSAGSESAEKFSNLLLETLWRMMYFPIPTVAAINGHAFAGGAFLALAHDYRVMLPDRGWISWNETLLKLRIREALRELIEVKIDNRAIRESVVFAKRVTGPEAVKLGIIDKVASAKDLIGEAKSLGLGALGRNNIDRDMLKVMKQDMFPRKEDPKTAVPKL